MAFGSLLLFPLFLRQSAEENFAGQLPLSTESFPVGDVWRSYRLINIKLPNVFLSSTIGWPAYTRRSLTFIPSARARVFPCPSTIDRSNFFPLLSGTQSRLVRVCGIHFLLLWAKLSQPSLVDRQWFTCRATSSMLLLRRRTIVVWKRSRIDQQTQSSSKHTQPNFWKLLETFQIEICACHETLTHRNYCLGIDSSLLRPNSLHWKASFFAINGGKVGLSTKALHCFHFICCQKDLSGHHFCLSFDIERVGRNYDSSSCPFLTDISDSEIRFLLETFKRYAISLISPLFNTPLPPPLPLLFFHPSLLLPLGTCDKSENSCCVPSAFSHVLTFSSVCVCVCVCAFVCVHLAPSVLAVFFSSEKTNKIAANQNEK